MHLVLYSTKRYFCLLQPPLLLVLHSPSFVNLHILSEEKLCKDRVTLGINMYSPDFEYDYIIEFLKKFGIHHLRVSITVPNMDENRNVDRKIQKKVRK